MTAFNIDGALTTTRSGSLIMRSAAARRREHFSHRTLTMPKFGDRRKISLFLAGRDDRNDDATMVLITGELMSYELRIASESEAEEIANLVNLAYRPAAGLAGWTHETNLISGSRISVSQVLSLFRAGSTIMALRRDAKMIACVHVESIGSDAYIGMLTTSPAMQGHGLGKDILHHAERYALEQYQCSAFKMSVLSHRPELLAFYQRRGYSLTGETAAFPADAGVGTPVIEGLQLLSLSKAVSD